MVRLYPPTSVEHKYPTPSHLILPSRPSEQVASPSFPTPSTSQPTLPTPEPKPATTMRFSILASLTLAASALAAPVLQTRQSSTTCGDNYYSEDQVSDALNQGYGYYEDDETVGDDSYPHQYNNCSSSYYIPTCRGVLFADPYSCELDEGFDFPVDGPWYEFPIEESGVYTGGMSSPFPLISSGETMLTLGYCNRVSWC